MKTFLVLTLLTGLVILTGTSPGTAQDLPKLSAQIDHVMLAVRDLAVTEKFFVDTLRFKEGPGGRLPNGMKNFILGFAGKTYIEPVTVYDADKASWLETFLSKHEGSPAMALRVASAEQTAEYLKERGFAIAGPLAGGPPVAGHDASEAMFQYVIFTEPVLPNGLFFIEYNEDLRRELVQQLPAEKRSFTQHPNTASRLRAVWVAVEDLDKATELYQAIGLQAGDATPISYLNALARSIWMDENGCILLLQAEDADSPVASFLKNRGEGIMGVTLAVGNLDKVQDILKAGLQQDFGSYTGFLGKSILIPAERAHGLFIEMVEE